MKVLDHGSLDLVEGWGSDEGIIRAARMSTGKGFLGWGPFHSPECIEFIRHYNGPPQSGLCKCGPGGPSTPGDEKLLRYLWEHDHATPFEMAGATFEVQAPIFVFREWHRHRVPFGYNEMSARYAPLPDVNYIPTVERLALGGGPSKQSQSLGGAILDREKAKEFQERLDAAYVNQQQLYEWALREGVPKELARVVLPVGRYSRMRATGNLRGWLGFLKLRMAPGAQYEIRMYANALHDELVNIFPRTLALFDEGAKT